MQPAHQTPLRRVVAAYRLPKHPEDWGLPPSDEGFQTAEELRQRMETVLRELRTTLRPLTVSEETPWYKGFLNADQETVLEAITGAYSYVRLVIDGNTLVPTWNQSDARRVALYAIAGIACISIGLRRRDAWKVIEAR